MGIESTPLFDRLGQHKHVLFMGMGGGFDVFASLPLMLASKRLGAEVHLANLSFADLSAVPLGVDPLIHVVEPLSPGSQTYFPERSLARFLNNRGEGMPIYAIERSGVRPTARALRQLAASLEIDAIVLVDGGTDSLMRGDESGLGTPAEDMTSLAAASALDVSGYLAAVGFGVDTFHGVSHYDFLENVAALTKTGGYLGAFSLLPGTPEVDAYLDAVAFAHAETRFRPSIVNGSIASSIAGEYGDVHFTQRTQGSELWINPLMSLVFSFTLEQVARNSLLLPHLKETQTLFEVVATIEAVRKGLSLRDKRTIPA